MSDPQERSWYDSHRTEILESNIATHDGRYERNMRVTTAEDITRMYASFNGQFDFSDTKKGFFPTLQTFFQDLATEELVACEWESLVPNSYPDFGSGEDNFEEVKVFYSVWSQFSSRKQFSWKDKYRYSDAPDRRTRRAMEKENKRLREEGVREFNSAVRALVAFVRKRDPRYLSNSHSYKDRQKNLREMAATQAARSRAANMAKISTQSIPDWSKSQSIEEEDPSTESEKEEQEQFECVVCRKMFKSEGQYDAHEKSRKHLKAVQQVLRKMHEDDANLGPDTTRDNGTRVDADQAELNDHDISADTENKVSMSYGEDLQHLLSRAESRSPASEAESHHPLAQGCTDSTRQEPLTYDPSNTIDEFNDYTQREYPEGVITSQSSTSRSDALDNVTEAFANSQVSSTQPRFGKAKAKRAKKAAAAQQLETSNLSQQHVCAACQVGFPSRSRLFDHIKKNPDHAMLSDKSAKPKQKR